MKSSLAYLTVAMQSYKVFLTQMSDPLIQCDNQVFLGLYYLYLLTFTFITFVAYISMFPFHQYQSEV
jgi:hypothetical protein